MFLNYFYLLCSLCLNGVIPPNRGQVISSFFGIEKEKHIESNIIFATREVSQLNCAHICLDEPKCRLSRFSQYSGVCLLYGGTQNRNSAELEKRYKPDRDEFVTFSKLGEFDPQTSRFIISEGPAKLSPNGMDGIYRSCDEISNKTNGVYNVRLINDKVVQVYCVMENVTGCNGSGWALAMKINGSKPTFSYDAPYWTHKLALNYPEHLANLDDQEMKSPIFWGMKARKICVGMKQGNATNWLEIQVGDYSLHYIFSNDIIIPTGLGVSSWKRLLKGAILHHACTKEGLNVVSGKQSALLKIRIGMIGGNLPCIKPKSLIGFGLNIITSSGNVILGQLETKSFGYILVK